MKIKYKLISKSTLVSAVLFTITSVFTLHMHDRGCIRLKLFFRRTYQDQNILSDTNYFETNAQFQIGELFLDNVFIA